MKGDEIVRHCDRHRNETATLGIHGTKYQNIWKWILEILTKFENREIKIFRVLELRNFSILITKSKNLQLFIFNLYFVGGPF